jgi:hypothetical protein
MKKQPLHPRPSHPIRTLDASTHELVRGGELTADHEIVSPRDPATGLPSGKRG